MWIPIKPGVSVGTPTWHGLCRMQCIQKSTAKRSSDARSGMKFHQSLAQWFLIAVGCNPRLLCSPMFLSMVVGTAITFLCWYVFQIWKIKDQYLEVPHKVCSWFMFGPNNPYHWLKELSPKISIHEDKENKHSMYYIYLYLDPCSNPNQGFQSLWYLVFMFSQSTAKMLYVLKHGPK